MKRWTAHQPRANQTLDADQFNAEQVSHRGSIASLDRTQLPVMPSIDAFVDGALHDTWLYRVGEQTEVVGTGVPSDQWRCMTSRNYAGRTVSCGGGTLTGHRGGMTLVEWSGAAFVNAFACYSFNEEIMEKRLLLRILVNNIVVAESSGMLQGSESFRIFGNIVLPPGDHEVQLQAVGLAAGNDEPLTNSGGSNTIMMYHVVNSLLFALARYR